MVHFLYKITNLINNKIYIGQTVQQPRCRWNRHKSDARKKNPTQYITRAMKKYGIDNFIFEVIAACKTYEDTNDTEIFIIAQHNSCNKKNGYNISSGGKNFGSSEKSRKKMSISSKKRWQNKEFRKKVILAMTGREVLPETRKKISDKQKGKIIPEESKKKMSLAHKGQIPWNKGIISSEKMKQKNREAHWGEKSWTAKLTELDVLEIRKKYNKNDCYQKIAKQYNVDPTTISQIIRRKTWKHI